MRLVPLLFLLLSCGHNPPKLPPRRVTILKQWHLLAKQDTQDIAQSQKLPQATNQHAIYRELARRAQRGEGLDLYAEGCPAGAKVDRSLPTAYNGWTYGALESEVTKSEFEDILTFLPLKLKVRFPAQTKVHCIEDPQLVEQNNLAMSDARGYFGFYLRLQSSQGKPKQFAIYRKALEETEGHAVADPVAYSRSKIEASLDRFEALIKERNQSFARALALDHSPSPVIIIGGLHAVDLEAQLRAQGMLVDVITPPGYPVENEKLIEELRAKLGPKIP